MNMRWRRRRRFARTVGYSLIALCGVFSILWPPDSVKAAASPLFAVAFVWSLLLTVGGGLAALSSAQGGWAGEYVGLWPLMFSLMVFAVAVATSGRGVLAAASTCLLAGVALGYYARWTDVAALRREALASRIDAERDGRHPGGYDVRDAD